ncbi:MAG: sodium:proton antiporter [Gemmatimonadetes bacterium]|nr:sodium:proton antiporter [Gemmatimonadota bacterium]
MIDALSWILLVSGSLFAVVGGIGLLRLPDFYCRMHGAGMTDTMGATLILAGLMLQAGLSFVTVKLIMILFFLLITSPTSTHSLARSALAHGIEPHLDKEKSPSKS